MTKDEKNERDILLSNLFTPGTPVSNPELFAGEVEQIRLVIDTINRIGQHAVIYGERGVGKTSIAKIIPELLKGFTENIIAERVNCDGQDTFISAWRKVLDSISMTYQGIGFGQQDLKVKGPIYSTYITDASGPFDIANLLKSIPDAVIIFDEFDRIQSQDITTLFADCIKSLSDNEIPVTLIIVGVADNISELITGHGSVERCITQISMPRMSNDELQMILTKRYPKAKMFFTEDVPRSIARLSQGFPHYTHALGLNAGRAALDRDSFEITIDDVRKSIEKSVKDTSASIKNNYFLAVRSSRKDSLYEMVLLACALADSDELGFFTSPAVRGPMNMITKRIYDIPAYAPHLAKFCEPARGKILERKGTPRRYIYRFSNPLMRPFVYLKGISKGIIPKNYSPI